MIEPTSGEA